MKIYIVQKGDTLYEIAQRNGQSLSLLRKANPDIEHSDRLTPGMKIRIPTPSKPVRKEGLAKQIPLKNFKSKSMPVNEFLSNQKKEVKEKPKVNKKAVEKKEEVTKEKKVSQKENHELNKKNAVKSNKEKKKKGNTEMNNPNVNKEENVQQEKEPKVNNEQMLNAPVNEPLHKMLNSNKLAPLQPLNDKEWGINTNKELKVKKQVNPEVPFMEDHYPNLMGPVKKKNQKQSHSNMTDNISQKMPIHQSYIPQSNQQTSAANKDKNMPIFGKGFPSYYQPQYGEAPTEQGGMPMPYGGMPGPYGGTGSMPYGEAPTEQGGMPMPYGGMPGPYGGTGSMPYGEAPTVQGGTPMPYGGMPGPYGGTGWMPYGEAPTEQGGTPMPYGGIPGPYGGTGSRPYGEVAMPYGLTPPAYVESSNAQNLYNGKQKNGVSQDIQLKGNNRNDHQQGQE